MLRINGELIDPNLVEDAFSRIKSEAEARLQISCCERDPEFMEQAEEEVIDSILIAQEAEKRHPEIPESDIAGRLEETIKLYREHGASWEMLEDQRDQLRNECEANLRMETFLSEILDGKGGPTDEELRAYYQEHLAEFRTQPEVRCLHLVKMLDRHEDPVALLESMRELREEALDGADFKALAERETEKENGEIDLDWMTLDRPSNPIESIVFSMREGEVTPVVAYENGYHLLKVVGVKRSEVPPFEELREQLAERWEFEQRRAALRSFAATLRPDAHIEHVEDDEA
ncbi:MAG: hypothetical protein HKN82_00410 [Akkermansiaceae bacterium]|nr:hypothetical protein [Akkermansiaceae bacterium]